MVAQERSGDRNRNAKKETIRATVEIKSREFFSVLDAWRLRGGWRDGRQEEIKMMVGFMRSTERMMILLIEIRVSWSTWVAQSVK